MRNLDPTGRFVVATMLTMGLAAPAAAGGGDRRAEQFAQFEKETGLAPLSVPHTDGDYLGKTHRGYEVLFTVKAGDVWGRYAARLAMGEIGREVGGVLAFLTRSMEYASGPTGSTLDRLLSKVIGQPLALTMVLTHGRTNAPHLDIYPGYAVVKPDIELPVQGKIGSGAGEVRSGDVDLARRILADKKLVRRLKDLRGAYIRVDGVGVTLMWAGDEKEYSSMIRDHGGYWKMINAFLDDLADVADLLGPAPAG